MDIVANARMTLVRTLAYVTFVLNQVRVRYLDLFVRYVIVKVFLGPSKLLLVVCSYS